MKIIMERDERSGFWCVWVEQEGQEPSVPMSASIPRVETLGSADDAEGMGRLQVSMSRALALTIASKVKLLVFPLPSSVQDRLESSAERLERGLEQLEIQYRLPAKPSVHESGVVHEARSAQAAVAGGLPYKEGFMRIMAALGSSTL